MAMTTPGQLDDAGDTTVAQVHERLRSAILSGELAAGERMTQAALVSRFGCGRTPLREALRMLHREGLVTARPNAMIQVASLSAPDAEELYILRIAIESAAMHITVPRLSSADIGELEALMGKMEHFRR